ncbi:MAG: hypothetical protein GWP06_16170 [Actinobacteria bacterium]|nr:hypothetical protein [Actinomycetota bacterium]
MIVTSVFQQKIKEPIVTQVKPLTTTASILEVDPDISPDGSKVIYSSDENENLDIWVREIASGQRLNITQDYAGNDGNAKWSPDGNWISFTSSRDGGGIYLVSEFGGIISQIVPSHDFRDFGGLNWSFDSKKLVYTINDTLHTVTVSDRAKIIIPLPHNCREPAWSPEGDRIVYISILKKSINSQIWTVKLDDANPVLIFEGSGKFFTPFWSRDGKRIFFKWLKNGIRDLWWIPVDKKGNPTAPVKQLTTGWNIFDFSFSRDDTKLAYCKAIQRFNIWSIPLKAERIFKFDDALQVTSENQSMNEFTISPDYEWLAFTSRRNGMNDIWLIRKNGKDLRQLTADSLYEEGLSWSPNGSRIAYHAVQNKNSNIYTVSIVGGAVRTLIKNPANDSYPSWSPTGDSIIFQSDRSGNQEIWMTSLRNNTVKQLTDHKDYDGNASFSSDGASIAFVSNRSGTFEIYIASIKTSAIRKLTSIKSNAIIDPIWSIDNKTIYIAYSPDEEDRSRKIWEISVKDGSARKIFDFKGTIIQEGPTASLARDHERLYFIRQYYVADIWLAQLEYK